jgi:hypothetical protein
MRALFLLLVLANAAFYAYGIVARQQGDTDSQIPLLEISPEKIRLIKSTSGAAAAKPSKAPAGTVSAAPAACLEWGVFAGPDVARAAAALGRLELPQALVQRAVADAGGYWVYIPPLKTKADVDKKLGELKALGVTEFFVVQDTTPWRNAISLGIFRTEEAARGFLDALRGKGMQSAVAERRENFLRQIAYYVREPTEAIVAKLAELQREFPGTQIKAMACPPPDAAKG